MRDGSHEQGAAVRDSDPEQNKHSVILVTMDQWNEQQRALAIKMFFIKTVIV